MDKKPTPVERIQHVLQAISDIREFMHGVELITFNQDIKLQSAVKYKFLIIGEAIRHVDLDILQKYDYPWHIPLSFRNYIIHSYHGIKLERVYHAAFDMDELEEVMQKILQDEF